MPTPSHLHTKTLDNLIILFLFQFAFSAHFNLGITYKIEVRFGSFWEWGRGRFTACDFTHSPIPYPLWDHFQCYFGNEPGYRRVQQKLFGKSVETKTLLLYQY